MSREELFDLVELALIGSTRPIAVKVSADSGLGVVDVNTGVIGEVVGI
ncbi:MAG TPA: hypothetical protein VEF72_11935 [Mycobacterium sp.]|nr:hypothetical protein [Mycobacterium sp.]